MDSPVNGNFVGLSNYISLLQNSSFLLAASNTLLFTVISVPLIMMMALVLALLLNRAIYFRNQIRTLFISPLVIPVASVVLVWQIVFSNNGVINGSQEDAVGFLRLKFIPDEVVFNRYDDGQLSSIIHEEVGECFLGARSVEETAKIIQNKVELYLNE